MSLKFSMDRLRRAAVHFAVIICCCAPATAGTAQNRAASVTPEQDRQWADEAAKLALAEARNYAIQLGQQDGSKLKLAEQPALKWSNSYDATVHGSVFVWTGEGRPQAIASMYKFFTTKFEFSAEFHSLAEEPLLAFKGSQIVWQPREAGIELKALAGIAAPAKTATGRLVQMRDITRDFSAELTTVSKVRHDLRLLTQPLFRYGGAPGEVIDGAIFAYTRATDPDVLLLLEARAGEGNELRWKFALARMHVGALKVRYRDDEVWSVAELSHPYLRKNERYTTFQNLPEPNIDNK